MEKQLLYIIEDGYITKCIYADEILNAYSLKSAINQIAGDFFINIKGYQHEVRKRTSLKNKIPLYLSPQALFFYYFDRAGRRYLINYFALVGAFYDDDIIFVFKSGVILRLDSSLPVLKKEIKKVCEITNHLKKMYALS